MFASVVRPHRLPEWHGLPCHPLGLLQGWAACPGKDEGPWRQDTQACFTYQLSTECLLCALGT